MSDKPQTSSLQRTLDEVAAEAASWPAWKREKMREMARAGRAPETRESLPCDDAEIMRLWRECGLPEWFLGNGGTNHKLLVFARRIRSDAWVEGNLYD